MVFIRFFIAAWLLCSFGINSMPQSVSKYVPQAQLVGEGKLTYLFWDVYDAQLFAPAGKWQNSPPYALKLSYLRDLNGKAIAERSVKEMKKQGANNQQQLEQWLQVMTDIFPDVAEGDTITGVLQSDYSTVFYKNDAQIGVVEDKAFGEQFFAIWLDDKTSEPELRKKLIGANSE